MPSRRLLLIPVLHTGADHGTMAGVVQARRLAELGFAGVSKSDRAVARSWDAIEGFVRSLPDSLSSYRVYQDGLPVCGREMDIVRELAGQGSRNHALLLDLHLRGARIMGSEAPDLLVKELLALRAAADPRGPGSPRADTQQEAASLLARRDEFLGARIDETLRPGETGILFIGSLHDVSSALPPDIEVVRPLSGIVV